MNGRYGNTIDHKWGRRRAGHAPGGNKGTDSLTFTEALF